MTTQQANQTNLNQLWRAPEKVMKLARMGSAHQCRLSFMRTLLRRLKHEQWQFKRSHWNIDQQGVGHAVYQAIGPQRTYSLVVFAHDIPAELRSDRVIAQAWDATFTLFDGVPAQADIDRLEKNVPLQEAGRVSSSEVSLSRANRSDRLFSYVRDCLATGRQPERSELENVGYLMRTTAVYGAGKFGAADRDLVWLRDELCGPFRAEMLSVWLTRAFTVDLVEHMAKAKGGAQAVSLENELRRCLGVGNSTGLGMAPFLVNHPTLINNWIIAREEALARVRNISSVEPEKATELKDYLARAILNAQQWHSAHPIQAPKIVQLLEDLEKLNQYLNRFDFTAEKPLNLLYQWSEQNLSLEGQEQLAMLLMEPYSELVDGLTDCMLADETRLPMINGRMCVSEMRELLRQHYDWALTTDYTIDDNRSRFWYVSEEKLEPRLGERFDEPGVELEQPLCIGWHIWSLYQALEARVDSEPLATFLMKQPQFRHIVRRAQQIKSHPYMEIHDNLIASDMLPIDMLRLKLSFFGATKFDPRSDRWVRINMFQYAPFPDELAQLPEDDWAYPPLTRNSQ